MVTDVDALLHDGLEEDHDLEGEDLPERLHPQEGGLGDEIPEAFPARERGGWIIGRELFAGSGMADRMICGAGPRGCGWGDASSKLGQILHQGLDGAGVFELLDSCLGSCMKSQHNRGA